MYNDSAAIMMLNTLTSTHAGSGTELSYIDMPIQREGHTGYPKIEASTLKGCIRASVTEKNSGEKEAIERIFGNADNGDFASALSLTDARLLFFPVKSAKGVFGWVTCPMVLERFFKDYLLTNGKEFAGSFKAEGVNLVTDTCVLDQRLNNENIIMLEDYTYIVDKKTEKSGQFTAFLTEFIKLLPVNSITRDMMAAHAVVLNDNDFAGFVKYSTEVNTRIKIEPSTGTVADTGLFTEEYLPPECILYSLLFFTDSHQAQKSGSDENRMNKEQVKKTFVNWLSGGTIQVGANSTLGKGLIQLEIWEGK